MKNYLLSSLLLLTAATLLSTNSKAQSPILWGMAQGGGENGDGTIFSFNTAGNHAAEEHAFGSESDGSEPSCTLLKAGSGLLYGVAGSGGSKNVGAIFSYDVSSGTETPLYSFLSADTDAQLPVASLIQVTNTLLYGTTEMGGDYYEGALYSFNTSSNTLIVLHSFGSGNDARGPEGALFQFSDSLLYGLSTGGGTYGEGAIYKYNISTGIETVVYNFGGVAGDAESSEGALIQGTDGLLYGMTYGGGANGVGAIFSFNPSTEVETVVHSFGTGTDGSTADGTLTQVTDSLLYGMTNQGGANGDGTIFSYNIYTQKETDVHDFGSGTDGQYPVYGPLLKASNGLLYGMTYQGGANYYGIVFSFEISTNTETNLLSFGGNGYGQYPKGGFIEDDATGINQLSVNNDQLTVYPNPTSGQFTLRVIGNDMNANLEVYDVMGKKVYQTVVSNSQQQIDLSAQPAGMYFIYFNSGENAAVAKVLLIK